MRQFSNTTAALNVYDKFMVDHNKRSERIKTMNEAKHWFVVRDIQISKVQLALFKDLSPIGNRKQCDTMSLNQIRRYVDAQDR
jgi:hypothetical protein